MAKNKKTAKGTVIYQTKDGKIAFRGKLERDTVWGNLNQIAELFGRDKSVISRHIRKVFESGELEPGATVAKIATVQMEGERQVAREIEYYGLDLILSVGYRVDSRQATQFRIWATGIIKQHLLKGYTIDKRRVARNYQQFMQAVASVKALLPESEEVKAKDVLELVNAFASTWVSLDAYDKDSLPKSGATRKRVAFTAESLCEALAEFKKDLVTVKQATEIFAQERQAGNVAGIVGNIFQSFDQQDLYPTIEEKAAHLLYFMVKNHPFVDGNKRSGAFAFVWFLQKAGVLRGSLTPEALTALTLLVAESDPKDKEKMTGLVILLLERK